MQFDAGFAGVDIGKFPVDTADGNKLAKDLHAAAVPVRSAGLIELTFSPQISLKQTKLLVTGWKPWQRLGRFGQGLIGNCYLTCQFSNALLKVKGREPNQP